MYPASIVAFVPVVALTLATTATAAPAPSGPHPRLWLDSATVSGLKTEASSPNSGVSRGAARCLAARTDPAEYSMGGWQGFEFVTTLSGCLASYEATGNADDLATAIKYWKVLLDDYQNVGDGAGGDDVVTHDTGYAMRTFAPYSAIAYDWLHDAPGVTEELRAHARARFAAWVSFYANNGYLRHMPGSNYEAGFAFAATLISIAEGSEAGSDGDSHWATVHDTIWGQDLASGFGSGGVLDGGDWPEGWQYGPLSVLELSLAARALGDNGAKVPGIETWTDSLVRRFVHGLTPVTHQTFAAGDTEATTNHLDPTNGALLAAIVGPSSETARSWARALNDGLALTNDNPLFDALAAARSGASAPVPVTEPTSHLARGTGNWYVRGSWSKDTVWSVFSCSHRLVDDHQHNDAGNWVLTRGADDVVVDPSPYGSLSSLTGNAPAVDSAVLPSGYSPSQANWGQTTRLVWAKQASSGVGVARCDYADQFRLSDVPSDVTHAIRDFVMVPDGGDGAVVLVDRVVTGDASRGLHLRVRTPTALSLSGDTTTGTVGASSFSVRKLWASSGTPNVREMPQTPECSSENRGTCDMSRLPSGQEYRLDVSGPSAAAIHVVDARTAGQKAADSSLLSGTGYRGALVSLAHTRVAVISNDGGDGAAGTSLSYKVPAGSGTVHVVLDAPADANGQSDVTSRSDGADCAVTVTPHAGAGTAYDGRGLVVRLSDTCAVTEDPPTATDGGAPPSSGDGTGGGTSSSGAGGAGAGGFPFASSGGAATDGGAGGSSGATEDPSSGGSGSGNFPPPGCALVRGPTRMQSGGVAAALGMLGMVLVRRRRRRVASRAVGHGVFAGTCRKRASSG